jgi:hypothetical protein
MPKRMHLALGAIAPVDPDLPDRHPPASGQVEKLNIEAEPIEPADGKKFSGDLPAEAFESALRVTDPGNSEKLHEFVERLPHQHPVERLILGNQGVTNCP